jgi:hypothetical protein
MCVLSLISIGGEDNRRTRKADEDDIISSLRNEIHSLAPAGAEYS